MALSKIIRTKTQARGGITPAEKIALDEHAQLWIKRIMRTGRCDRAALTQAILDLYAAADLKAPRVVIVPSPLVMAIAGGISAAIWHLRKSANIATRAATEADTIAATRAATSEAIDTQLIAPRVATDTATNLATRVATHAATDGTTDAATLTATDVATGVATSTATYAATHAATHAATLEATYNATHDETRAATDAATRVATHAATYVATREATYVATLKATRVATDAATDAATRVATHAATSAATLTAILTVTDAATAGDINTYADTSSANLVSFMLSCVRSWSNMYQGGNMWGQWDCYLTAARDVLGLDLSCHAKYSAWERAAIHGGFRMMHEEFCIVSDFPDRLLVDDSNRPHCDDGPSHLWADGFAIWHIHGVRVPRFIVESPQDITVDIIEQEKNAEVRRIMIQRYGQVRYIQDSGAKLVHSDEFGELYRKERPDDTPIEMVKVINSTPEPDGSFKHYWLRVEPGSETAHEAIASTWRKKDGTRVFAKHQSYQPTIES